METQEINLNEKVMEKKYKLTDEISFAGRPLYQIEALRDFADIKIGDKGGWVGDETNLSHDGECWIHEGSRVFGDVLITENAHIYNSQVVGCVTVKGNSSLDGVDIYAEQPVEFDDTTLHIKDWYKDLRLY